MNERLTRLERENRILKWAGAGMLVLGMVVPVAAHEVGWILMVPPLRTRPILHVDTKAPLSEWEFRNSYDTARECETYRERLWKRYAGSEQMIEFDRFFYGRCVPASVVYPQAKEK